MRKSQEGLDMQILWRRFSHVDSLSGFTWILPVNWNVYAMHVVTLSATERKYIPKNTYEELS